MKNRRLNKINVKELVIGESYKVRSSWERRGKVSVYLGESEVFNERENKHLKAYRFGYGKGYIDISENKITLLEKVGE